jgi:hypothetical protein
MKRLALILALLALPASADGLAESSFVLPSSANVQGAFNAYFKTKVTIFNAESEPLSLTIYLSTPSGRITRNLLVSANSFNTYENFLDEVFGYTGGGSLAFIGTGVFGLNAEVYVDGPNGRYSTPIAPITTSVDKIVGAAEAGQSFAFGLHAENGNRVNFGCTNFSPSPATVRATVYTFTPVGTAVVNMSLGAQSWQQQAAPITGDLMYISFVWTGGGDDAHAIYCYAVNVNNESNDGTLVPVVRMP